MRQSIIEVLQSDAGLAVRRVQERERERECLEFSLLANLFGRLAPLFVRSEAKKGFYRASNSTTRQILAPNGGSHALSGGRTYAGL